jgi:hypothetical protein
MERHTLQEYIRWGSLGNNLLYVKRLELLRLPSLTLGTTGSPFPMTRMDTIIGPDRDFAAKRDLRP